MTYTELQQLKQQTDALTLEEKLELIAYLAEKARQTQPTIQPRQRWSEMRGLIAAPALGEDAQAWVSRTRQEADEHRGSELEKLMQVEDYFEFLADDDIRIKGTRIGIEHILDEYLYGRKSAEAIAEQFHTVTLEQVYATIFYYLQNRDKVEQYLENWLKYTQKAQAEHDRNPPPVVSRLRKLKAERQAIHAVK